MLTQLDFLSKSRTDLSTFGVMPILSFFTSPLCFLKQSQLTSVKRDAALKNHFKIAELPIWTIYRKLWPPAAFFFLVCSNRSEVNDYTKAPAIMMFLVLRIVMICAAKAAESTNAQFPFSTAQLLAV
ncbi:MAG: hypothetical protein QM296_09460 [Bacillota bacterium]|nr:hypothetical protein [Bacillota bacterium]